MWTLVISFSSDSAPKMNSEIFSLFLSWCVWRPQDPIRCCCDVSWKYFSSWFLLLFSIFLLFGISYCLLLNPSFQSYGRKHVFLSGRKGLSVYILFATSLVRNQMQSFNHVSLTCWYVLVMLISSVIHCYANIQCWKWNGKMGEKPEGGRCASEIFQPFNLKTFSNLEHLDFGQQISDQSY